MSTYPVEIKNFNPLTDSPVSCINFRGLYKVKIDIDDGKIESLRKEYHNTCVDYFCDNLFMKISGGQDEMKIIDAQNAWHTYEEGLSVLNYLKYESSLRFPTQTEFDEWIKFFNRYVDVLYRTKPILLEIGWNVIRMQYVRDMVKRKYELIFKYDESEWWERAQLPEVVHAISGVDWDYTGIETKVSEIIRPLELKPSMRIDPDKLYNLETILKVFKVEIFSDDSNGMRIKKDEHNKSVQTFVDIIFPNLRNSNGCMRIREVQQAISIYNDGLGVLEFIENVERLRNPTDEEFNEWLKFFNQSHSILVKVSPIILDYAWNVIQTRFVFEMCHKKYDLVFNRAVEDWYTNATIPINVETFRGNTLVWNYADIQKIMFALIKDIKLPE